MLVIYHSSGMQIQGNQKSTILMCSSNLILVAILMGLKHLTTMGKLCIEERFTLHNQTRNRALFPNIYQWRRMFEQLGQVFKVTYDNK